MQMKKFLMLLVLVVMCGEIADAQSLYIPRYKKKKEVRDYSRIWSVSGPSPLVAVTI